MLFVFIGIVVMLITFISMTLGFSHKPPKSFKVWRWPVALVVLLVFMLLGSIKSVPTGHTGIVVTFGKVADIALDAGVHFKNPFSRVVHMDNRTKKETVDLRAFSSDIQEVSVKYTLNYQIDQQTAIQLYKTVGIDYYNIIIQPKVIESVKGVISQFNAEALVACRTEVAMQIEQAISAALNLNNIKVMATSIEDIDFTDAFTDAVEAKQVAEQDKLRIQTEAETAIIQAEAEAQVKLIQAQAQADANELLAEALTDKILKKQAIERWDGKLPTVLTDGSDILDLTGLVGK